MITIRPATSRDKEALLKISTTIWDDDYLPNVIDKWITDENGDFVVAEYGGVVAGCARLTRLTPKDAWLEGLRVSLDFQGKGIGKALNDYFISQHKQYKTMRLSTFIDNEASIHIMEHKGFRRTASFKIMEAVLLPTVEPTKQVECLHNKNEILDFLDSKQLLLRKNFLSFDWTFQKLDNQLLEELIAEESVFGCRNASGQLDGLIILSSRHCKSQNLSISYLQTINKYDALLAFARYEGQRRGLNSLITMCPADHKLQQALQQNGFTSFSNHSLNVYVYTLTVNS